MFESNFHLGREKVRWERLLLFFVLLAVPAILISCGSNAATTTTTPTITVTCTPTAVTVLGTSQCTASVLNLSSTLVNWSVSGTGTGSISTGGVYTAPAAVPTSNVVTVTATSQAQSSLTATASLTIQAATAITAVICNDSSGVQASTVSSGNHLACTAFASVSTGTTVPVIWTVTSANKLGGNVGSISAQGVYTAPLVPPPGQTVTITATSQAVATETMSVTATVVFGNAVLSGQYVFSTGGRLTTNAFWARVGRFTAGGGTISGGTEDTNQGGAPNTVDSVATAGAMPPPRNFTGSYSIGPDGRGTMQFCEDTTSPCPQGSPGTANFRIVIISPQQAQIIEFSPAGTNSATTAAGGEILLQAQLVSPNNGNLSGTYSFNFAGVSSAATEESEVGEFAANGFGNITAGSASPPAPGEIDINAGGSAALPATTYTISSNGRGTVALNGLNFSFYPVSASRAKFIEIDTAAVATPTTPASVLFGDAYKQQTSSNCGWGMNALSGSTVLETTGTSTGVVIADVGSFDVTDTSGAFTGASIDENNGGTVSSQAGTLSGSYTMDPCGRGTLTVGAHSYVFYVISASDAVLQETTSGVISHGLLLPSQGGPFVNSTLTGSYAFRFTGTDAAGAGGNREDLLGQVTSAGSGTSLAGTVDVNDFGATQTSVAIANGTYLPTPAGTLRGTVALPLNTTPSATTRNFVMYMVSPTLFYALDVDPSPAGTAIGVINNQF